MTPVNAKKILFLFADNSVKTGKADAEALKLLLEEAALNLPSQYEIYISYARSLSYFVCNERSVIRDHHNRKNLEEYDFVYFRKAGTVMQQMLACSLYLETNGIPFYDREIFSSNSRNKLSQAFLMQYHQLPIVPTLFCRNKRRLLRLTTKKYADSFPFPVIAKATGGSRGDANFLASSPEELEKIIRSEKRHFIIQQFIPNDGDFRFFTVNGKVRGVIERKTAKDTHLSNTSKGAEASLVSLDKMKPEVLRLAVEAAHVFRRDCAGVDIMFDKQTLQPYLLEVNRAPQIEHSSFETEKSHWMMEAIEETITDHQPRTLATKPNHIGRFEIVYINYKDKAEEKITAKIDTGADSSSLHATDIVIKDGVLYCNIRGHQFSFTNHQLKIVKSSNGLKQQRYLVMLPIRIGKKVYDIKVTLTDRSAMKHEMLIGRRFLRANKFIVDVSKRYSQSGRGRTAK